MRHSPRMKGMVLNPPRCFAGIFTAADRSASFFSPLASSAMALSSLASEEEPATASGEVWGRHRLPVSAQHPSLVMFVALWELKTGMRCTHAFIKESG